MKEPHAQASFVCVTMPISGKTVAEVTIEALASILAGDPEELGVHLHLLQRDVAVGQTKVKIHCHCLIVDANGRTKVDRLVEFMRNAIVDYAIPRERMAEARARDQKFRSGSAVSALHREAIRAFTDLKTTGEGGEMLLYLLTERFLKLPQVICKMDLKTDTRMHYHGADGVYAGVDDDGILKLFWGESKLYSDTASAVRECLKSLSPFLLESDNEKSGREQDLLLLSDKADLEDPGLTAAFKKYFDKKSPLSNRVKYCGVALVGFDADFYPSSSNTTISAQVINAANAEIAYWSKTVGNRLTEEKLEIFDIEIFCLPFPSVEAFREAFLRALGN